MIRDRNINYKYKNEYWPVGTFSCFTGASGATVDAVDGNPLVALSLDTPIVADPHCETGSGINATKWGTIDANSLSADFITLDVEMTAEAADGMEAILFGIEWLYLPKLTDGPQVSDQADPTDA